MGLQITWTRYGRAAGMALRDAIREAKSGEPLAPVTVVVPSNPVGVGARRLLASGVLGPICAPGIGLAAVTFLTTYRLAELLGAPALAADGRRPLSTPVLAAAIRNALANEPGIFGPVASHAATESALVAAYRELRGCSDGALTRIAQQSPRAEDVIRIHNSARARLARDWYDEQDLMMSAVHAVGAGGHGVAELGAVIVHLPQRTSRHAAALLRAMSHATPMTVVAGTTGDAPADADVVEALGLIAGDGVVPATPGGHEALVDAARTRIVTTSDADDEVRAALRAVVDATRAGVPLDRIAILHSSHDPYARLVHEQLAAAAIPANGTAVVPAAQRLAGRTLLQLLELPDSDFRRQDVFAWLSSAPVLHDGRWAPLGAWELISRDAAVVAGRAEWDELLARYADERDGRANELASDPEEEAWRAERASDDAGRARALRGFMLDLIDGLADAAARPKPWAEHAAWAHDMLARILGDESRRTRWPVGEQRAAEHVDLALERLGAIDAVEGTTSLAVFARTLELELETDVGRVGRLGEGVLVGSIGTGVGVDLDLVIILGLAEGVFPAPVRDDSLLPDEEREAAGGELALRSRRVEREHRELLATIASAGRQLLCVPRGDLRRSSQRVASRWVVDIAGHLAGASWTSADFDLAHEPWLDHIPSFAAGLRRVEFPATAQEHRVRDLMATARRGPLLSEHTTDPLVRDAARVIESRRSSDFTRFDGNLAGLRIPSPAETTTSPTRLEQWSSCPLTYLFELLRIAEVDNPEERLAITAIDKGNLVHLVLERFIREVLARPRDEQPEPAEPWSDRDRARLIEIGRAVCDEFERRGITGRPIFWRRDKRLILSELERFLEADDEHRAKHSTRPLEAELAFGLKGAALAAVPLQLPDGRCVRFRGKADRVDEGADGSLHIVDYKTGGATGYTDLSEENPDQRGKRLQLAVYGVAARLHHSAPDAPVLAEYWFVSRKGRFEHYGYPVTVEVLERVGRTLGTMVAGIEAGIFPAHPTATSTTPRWIGGHHCAACDPDGLGVAELRRAFERKRADPALAPYADLAEPLEAPSESEQPDG